jgi:hypothetical protein
MRGTAPHWPSWRVTSLGVVGGVLVRWHRTRPVGRITPTAAVPGTSQTAMSLIGLRDSGWAVLYGEVLVCDRKQGGQYREHIKS